MKMTNQSPNAEIKQVLSEYTEQKKGLEKRIIECDTLNFKARTSSSVAQYLTSTTARDTNERLKAAQERNQQLLKDLEKAKALLRTESTFSPTEDELRAAAANYRSFLLMECDR